MTIIFVESSARRRSADEVIVISEVISDVKKKTLDVIDLVSPASSPTSLHTHQLATHNAPGIPF